MTSLAGRIALLVAVVTIFLGISEISGKLVLYILYGVYVALLILVIIFLVCV